PLWFLFVAGSATGLSFVAAASLPRWSYKRVQRIACAVTYVHDDATIGVVEFLHAPCAYSDPMPSYATYDNYRAISQRSHIRRYDRRPYPADTPAPAPGLVAPSSAGPTARPCGQLSGDGHECQRRLRQEQRAGLVRRTRRLVNDLV